MTTVFITGATSGFGEACARRYAEEESQLILIGRRQDRLLALRQELREKCEVHVAPLDVRDNNAVQDVLDNLPGRFRDIDILINNAGLALGLEPAHRTDPDDWETMVDTNIKGLLYVTRKILPIMVDREHGYIINIGSVAGNWPYPGGNVYGATKAFVKQFSNNLRADLLGTNIRITNIEPGIAETEFSTVRFKGDAKKAAQIYEGTKALSGKDIADIIFWLTSLPPHINVNSMEVMPITQGFGPFAFSRQ